MKALRRKDIGVKANSANRSSEKNLSRYALNDDIHDLDEPASIKGEPEIIPGQKPASGKVDQFWADHEQPMIGGRPTGPKSEA